MIGKADGRAVIVLPVRAPFKTGLARGVGVLTQLGQRPHGGCMAHRLFGRGLRLRQIIAPWRTRWAALIPRRAHGALGLCAFAGFAALA